MNCLFIFGTRPEAIKLAPIIKIFEKTVDFGVKLCSTGQHREMLKQVLDFFEINPDYELNVMKDNQNLFDLTTDILSRLKPVIEEVTPDYIFVQGDTTTAFVGALAGFYKKIPIVHIEAGLRSFNKFSPFPEEINRVLVGHIADLHFAPTEKAKDNLRKEGIEKNVFVVGNTVIDALMLGLKIIENNQEIKKAIRDFFEFLDFGKKIILVTAHRRESLGEGFRNICEALREVATSNKEIEIVYPVHLNPNVRQPVFEILGEIKNIKLIEPLDYPKLIYLMEKSYCIITDSGGIQEEAPSLGKPVLVIRDVTERTEGIEAGTAKLIGTEKTKIVKWMEKLLNDKQIYKEMAKAKNPYGDGQSAQRIKEIMLKI